MSTKLKINSVGLLGFGAFGRLMAGHLQRHFRIVAHDPALTTEDEAVRDGVRIGSIAEVGRCDLVVLAVPVADLAVAISDIRPFLKPGAVVVDVGSVKVEPAQVMSAMLPPDVEIVGTHPLFGPQSARDGIAGHKIAVCPVRGRSVLRIAAFLRRVLRLHVVLTSPENHDREVAVVQGITHLIANVLIRMEPLPSRMTTASFDLLVRATEMVRYDARSVFLAIERHNPYAPDVRDRFYAIAERVRRELEEKA